MAVATLTSDAPPQRFFARWIDHATWSQWSPDTEWVHLDGPVEAGTRGVLKPTKGPKARFTISALQPDREYTDTTHLPGADLVFQHLATQQDGRTRLDVHVSITGPLSPLWRRLLGGQFRASVPADLRRLVDLVEAG